MTSPEVAFWLRWVEAEGGVVESPVDDSTPATVLLPPGLQQLLELPELVSATDDPEAAREEDLLLLIPGHPVLDAAASSVVAGGDAGRCHLPWPREPAPTLPVLLTRARDELPIDHGQLEALDRARSVYHPLLRLGVLATYDVDERFQEREEVWVDATSGTPIGRLEPRAFLTEPDTVNAAVAPDVGAALAAADAALRRRAAARGAILARDSRGSVNEQRSRALAYYEDALAAIERRRAAAPPERRATYATQAEAMRAERERRLQEIAERQTIRFELTPYRLHLVMSPALAMTATIRRGERRWRHTLTWLLNDEVFIPVRCPRCRAQAPLVAKREALGCRECLPRPAPQEPPRPAVVDLSPAPAPRAETPSREPVAPPSPRDTTERPAARRGGPRAPGTARNPDVRIASPGTLRTIQRELRRLDREGDRLASIIWGAAARGEPVAEQLRLPRSSFDVLCRLLGAAGPLVAIGLAAGDRPMSCSSETRPLSPAHAVTSGTVAAGQGRRPAHHHYSLCWTVVAGRPVVIELLPWSHLRADELPPVAELPRLLRMPWNLPRPAELDPIEAALWDRDLVDLGLPTVLRCLSMRAMLAESVTRYSPPVAAAALAVLGAGLSRTRRTPGRSSQIHRVPTPLVNDAVRQFRRELGGPF